MDNLDGLTGAGFPHTQGHRRLAGARTACDPDDDRREWFAIQFLHGGKIPAFPPTVNLVVDQKGCIRE
jgi:hypothetical protein